MFAVYSPKERKALQWLHSGSLHIQKAKNFNDYDRKIGYYKYVDITL